MLAVILTKSFRCLCFTLKLTYSYFSVYLNSVFGTARVWDCLQALRCQRGPLQRYRGDEETLDLCKRKIEFLLIIPVMWFKEQ